MGAWTTIRTIGVFAARSVKWLVFAVVAIELAGMAAIFIAGLILRGELAWSTEVAYDPYSLFVTVTGNKLTVNNSVGSDPADNRTVWMFGGSTMWGHCSNEFTIPSQTAKALNAENKPVRYTIVNYGIPSFNSILETKLLQKLLIERSQYPDIIVFYDGANDANEFAVKQHKYAHYGLRRMKSVVDASRAGTFGFLRPVHAFIGASYTLELYHRLMWLAAPIDKDSEALREYVRLTEYRYDYVDRISRCFGARFILVWQPLWWAQSCKGSGNDGPLIDLSETPRRNLKVSYEALRARLGAKPYFTDFSAALCDHDPGATYLRDGVHLTDHGRAIVAARMAEIIERRTAERVASRRICGASVE